MKVSVIIPNYNHAKYLPESLTSIISQTYLPKEIIVVDDCSTDNSLEVLKEYQQKYPFIRVLSNPFNKGVAFSINKGLETITSEFVTVMGADDILYPSFLEKAIHVFEKNPKIGICFADMHIFEDKNPSKLNRVSLARYSKTQIFSPEEFIYACQKNCHLAITGVPILHKRELLLKYKGYRSEIKIWMDVFINHQIGLRHYSAYIPEPLAAFRVLKHSYSHEILKNKRESVKLFLRVLEEIQKEGRHFVKMIRRSGILSLGNRYTPFIGCFSNINYWSFIPGIFKRKVKSVINKALIKAGYNSN